MLNIGECVRLQANIQRNPIDRLVLRCRGVFGVVIKRIGAGTGNVTYHVRFDNGHSGRFSEHELEVLVGKFKVGTKVRLVNMPDESAIALGYLRSSLFDLRNKVGVVTRYHRHREDLRQGEDAYEVKFIVNKNTYRYHCHEQLLEYGMKNEVTIVEED